MLERQVIYTAITGGRDCLKDPLHPDPKVEYLCFTDNPSLKSSIWNIIAIPDNVIHLFTSTEGAVDNTRLSRMYKLQPHRLLELDRSAVLWIDGSILLKAKRISAFMKANLQGKKFIVFHNPKRSSVKEEVAYCIQNNKDDPDLLTKQLDCYQQQKFPDNGGLINSGVILSNPTDDAVSTFNDAWWGQVMKYSKRDEVSFPLVAWALQFPFHVFPWKSLRDCPLIEIDEHNS
jgi:hypothetical protein